MKSHIAFVTEKVRVMIGNYNVLDKENVRTVIKMETHLKEVSIINKVIYENINIHGDRAAGVCEGGAGCVTTSSTACDFSNVYS